MLLEKLNKLFTGGHGWLGVIIFGGLGLLMAAAFGIGEYTVSSQATWVAKVGKQKVSQQDFQNAMNNLREQLSSRQGSNFNASYFQQPAVKKQVLDSLVNQALLGQSSADLKLVVTTGMVRQRIASTPAFQVNGKFDSGTYLSVLTNSRLTPIAYQQQVKSELATQLLPDAISGTSTIGKPDVDAYLRLQLQTRDANYLLLPRVPVTSTQVAASDVKNYYQAHQSEFMVPERVAIKYIELDAAKMKLPTKIDENTLLARYEQDKSRFVQPAQRLASHILIAVPDNATPAQQKAALAKADKVDKLAHAKGANFAALARKYSDDAGSKLQGGSLGWLEKGVTNKAFEDALFAMHKGEISKPVLGPDGYHIIWLRGIRAGEAKPFAQVRDKVLAEVEKTERAQQYSKIAGKLTDLVYENPTSLEPAAKKLGLPVESTDLFSRKGLKTGVAANSKVVQAAFSTNVLKDGNTSDPIQLGTNHIVVIHVVEHKTAAPKPLKAVSATIHEKILAERADAAAKKQAQGLLTQLEHGDTLASLAKKQHLQVARLSGVERQKQGVSQALLDKVFALPHPRSGKPSFGIANLGDGSYALLALQAVHAGDVSKVPQAQQAQLLAQMQQAYAQVATNEWLGTLRRNTDIQVAESRM